MIGLRLFNDFAEFGLYLTMRKLLKLITVTIGVSLLSSCGSVPDNITPVRNFELDRYLGTWYEIARLDHRFERGLEKVSATYALRDDGNVKVVNRGWNTEKGEWKEAVGKARFAGDETVGFLEVSFFGPFYGPYVVFELEPLNYEYAFISSGDGYLWFLSRTPTVSDTLKQAFIAKAKALGFNTDELIFVPQE